MSIIPDGNREWYNAIFDSLYFSLVNRYSIFLSSNRTIRLNIKALFTVDSSIIKLFSRLIFKEVGRDPKDSGKKKDWIEFLFKKMK